MRNRALLRKLGVLALLAAVGTTAYGDRRTAATDDLASPLAGAVRVGAAIQDAASASAAAARNLASFGILYATVMSRFSPEVRHSILSAVNGVRAIGAGRRPSSRPVQKCTARRGIAPAPRCSRA